MNKKGFTLIELITTFALATILIIILINIVVLIKDIYNQNNTKSKMAIEQSTLSKLMNEKFQKGLKYYSACSDSDFCYNFIFEDGETSKLVVDDNKIIFDEYIYKLENGVGVKNPTIKRTYVDIDDESNTDNFFTIKIPVYSKLYPNKNFGIDLTIVGPEEANIVIQ